MAANNNHVEISCRLCFCSKYPKLESLKSEEVVEKIKKYLLIKMEYSSGICLSCYNSIESFHEFYERIHAAQKNFHQTIFIEEVNEIILPPDLKSCSTQTEIHCEEQNHVTGTSGADKFCIPNDSYSQGNHKVKVTDEQSEFVGVKIEICEDISDSPNLVNNCDNSLSESQTKPKKTKVSKSRQITSEIEKKMVEFYNIKCEKCDNVTFTDFKMLSKHYSTVHNTQGYIKCCKRNIRANDKSYLRSHMFKHLQPDTCRCVICGKELSSLVTLKHHMILHKPAEERPFHCTECDKRFCCKNDLKNHEKAVHVPEGKREDYICDVCGKVFQKVANLRYHHSTVHLQERKYICEMCAKCFTTQSGLRSHMNAAHSSRGPIQCQECNKWLKNEDTFQKHQQLHQNNSYPCPNCEKVCNSSTSLRSHMVRHSEDRPYVCTICRKSFKTKTHLKNHSVQHSGGSNYKCPYCSKAFVNISNYYTHRKRMHLIGQEGQKPDVKIISSSCQELYPINRSIEEEQTNQLVYDCKMIKTGMESRSSQVSTSEVTLRPEIVPHSDVKYM